MGVAFYDLVPGVHGPRLSDASYGVKIADMFSVTFMRTGEMIYVLGRREDITCKECTHVHGLYIIQGLFSDPHSAEVAASDETFFIGPLPLNMALPHDPIQWAGLYWPLESKRDEPDPVNTIPSASPGDAPQP